MSIVGLLVRFMVIYVATIVLFGLVVFYFNYKPSGIIGLAILFGISGLLAESFAKKNGRYFTAMERRTAIVGMTAISLFFQWLFISMSGRFGEVKSGVLLFGFIVAVLLTALVIGVAFEVVCKILLKRGVIDEAASGYNRKGVQLVKNRFLNSTLKLLLITIVLIIITIISIPIVGYFAT